MIFDEPDHGAMSLINRKRILSAGRVLEKAVRRGENLGREYYRDLAARMAELGAPRAVVCACCVPDPEAVAKAAKRRLARWQRRLDSALRTVEVRAEQQGCGEREVARRMGQCAAQYTNRGAG